MNTIQAGRAVSSSLGVSPMRAQALSILKRTPIKSFHKYVEWRDTGDAAFYDPICTMGSTSLELAPHLGRYFKYLGYPNPAHAMVLLRELADNNINASATPLVKISFLVFKHIRDHLLNTGDNPLTRTLLNGRSDKDLARLAETDSRVESVFQNILDESHNE